MNSFPAYTIKPVKANGHRMFVLTSGGRTWSGPVRSIVINTFMADVARMQEAQKVKKEDNNA